ncbi:MAG: RNA polymerase sigma factor [Methyloligellaceae bacterium]
MTDPTDESALIKQAQNGDRTAFEALLRGYYDVIYRIAYKWCGNKADAEDITQNACIKLARSIGSFRFQSAFVTWLYPLVINTAKDWAKGRKPAAAAMDADLEPAQAPTGEDTVFARQVMAHVRTLPDKEKEALYLVFSEGLTHREAAAVMDCKESTVSWYIHEARKKLLSFQQMECRYG